MAANPERGEIDVDVSGRTFTLKPTMQNLVALEKRAGRTYGQLIDAMTDTDVTAMREMLFAYLQPFHGKEFEKIESVNALMDDLGDALDVRSVLTDVVLANRSRKKSDPQKAQAGIPATSGETPGASA